MWSLIVQKGLPPTRLMRYCCEELKEIGGKGRMKITGVRAAESVKRAENAGMVKIIGKPKTVQKMAENFGADYEISKAGGLVMNMDNDENRRLVERCYRTTSTLINPIIDWSDSDVWEFLKHYGYQANPLYQCGKKRIGCIGCPMQSGKKQIEDFDKYPKYKIYISEHLTECLHHIQKKNIRGNQDKKFSTGGQDLIVISLRSTYKIPV